MARKEMRLMTDEEVAQEIEELKNNEFVKLAIKEKTIKSKFRQKLYNLRSRERRGIELAKAGMTLENMDRMLKEMEDEDND